MKNCTPVWREAHFQLKMHKTHQGRTTFGSWDVEKVHAVVVEAYFEVLYKCTKHTSSGPLSEVEMSKQCTIIVAPSTYRSENAQNTPAPDHFGSWDVEKVHAVVARSTFPSQNVKNTTCSDHFWKLRCRKSARRCGAKHISKSKCTKHCSVGPLLEVEMSKKCTPLWREAHFEVKMLKTLGVRATFERSDVVLHGRHRGLCTLSKGSKTCELCSSFNYNHHYTTLHSSSMLHYNYNYTFTTFHYITLHSTTLHSTSLHYTTFHYTTFHCTTHTLLHYTTLNYTTLHYSTLHYIPVHSTTLQLHYSQLHYTTLHSTTLQFTTLTATTTTTTTTLILHLHYATLHYTEWHCTTPTVTTSTATAAATHYITLHYASDITLHYTTSR